MQIEASLKHEAWHVCMRLWRSHTEAFRMRVKQVSRAQNADTKTTQWPLEYVAFKRTLKSTYACPPSVSGPRVHWLWVSDAVLCSCGALGSGSSLPSEEISLQESKLAKQHFCLKVAVSAANLLGGRLIHHIFAYLISFRVCQACVSSQLPRFLVNCL